MASEWQMDKAISEQEHLDTYGWISGDYEEDGFDSWDSWDEEDSWEPVPGVGYMDDDYSWDYPDPLHGGAI